MLGKPSQQKVLIYQILDVLIESQNESDQVPDNTEKIKELVKTVLKDGPITIESILKKFDVSAIIFEACQGQLKYNTSIKNNNAKLLLFIAFNETNVFQVHFVHNEDGLNVDQKSVDIEDDNDQVNLIIEYAKEKYKEKTGACSFALGTLVTVKKPEAELGEENLYCGIIDNNAIVLSKTLNYAVVDSGLLRPNVSFKISENYLQNRYNEAAKHTTYPVTFSYEVNNFSEFAKANL